MNFSAFLSLYDLELFLPLLFCKTVFVNIIYQIARIFLER